MKILVLDDDPFASELLKIQLHACGLEQRGYLELVSAVRGSDATDLLENEPGAIGLIFCDLRMPEMDGVEFVRHLVRLGYRGGLILMSGEDESTLRTAAHLSRAHGLRVLGALRKPLPPDDLRRVLDTALVAESAATAPTVCTPEDLMDALEAGQVLNHYQPQVDLRTGEVVGMEALVRWKHPTHGLVFPMSFVPMAEECGQIGKLGRVVLRNALQDAGRWRAAGLDWHMAVNISMPNLAELQLPDFLAEEAEVSGFPLNRVVLEITESKLLDDPAAQLDVVTRLRLKQVDLSIDDFGTGYSCLAHLRDLPFAEIKLDRGFVTGAAHDRSKQAILQASLDLAREFRMRTVAEGIEQPADWHYMRQLGCELAQGHLIARAMPAEQVESWLADWETRRGEIVD